MLISVLLSLAAGWVDSVVYFRLGVFTAHVTGNIVLVFDALRRAKPEVLAGALSVPVFLVAAFVAALLGQALGPREPRTLRWLFGVETVLLAACLAVGVTLPEADLLLACLGIGAMAVQNASNRLLASLPSTAVMTSNVSQLVVDLAELAWTGRTDARRLRRTLAAVLAFAAGCALGAGSYAVAGLWCLLGPVLLLAAVTVLVRPG